MQEMFAKFWAKSVPGWNELLNVRHSACVKF